MKNLQPISSNNGVHVHRGLYDGKPAILKRFDKEDDRREILNYRILQRHNIPTIKTYFLGTDSFVMEDIDASKDWRLGVEGDIKDIEVTKSLAQWYFAFHEAGADVPELHTLYFEFDSITEKNLELLIAKLPAATETFEHILSNYNKLRNLLYSPTFTLTYNDFHWSNFIVRKDKKAAMMFDYNLLGRGYRLSDFRNVCWSMSDEAKAAFMDTYNGMYIEKHGHSRQEADIREERIDDVAGPLHALIWAFTERVDFPDWAIGQKDEAINKSVICFSLSYKTYYPAIYTNNDGGSSHKKATLYPSFVLLFPLFALQCIRQRA